MRLFTRRKFLAGALAGGISAAGVGYTRFWEPQALEVNQYRIRLSGARLTQPLRVLHLSDLHYSEVVPIEYLRASFTRAIAERPDFIVLTGDFLTWRMKAIPAYVEALQLLSAAAPCFAIAGNHDGGKWAKLSGGYPTLEPLADLLKASGIIFLHNEAYELRAKEQSVSLVGVGDWWSYDLFSEKAFDGVDKEQSQAVVLLSHNPDSKEAVADLPWDLMLCGHTHGGQLVVPFVNYRPFLPVKDTRYVEGICKYRDKHIYISRGVGNLHGMRFNCPPEISVLTLYS